MFHFKLKIRQKSFFGRALPGATRELTALPRPPIWFKRNGRERKGSEGKEREGEGRERNEGSGLSNLNIIPGYGQQRYNVLVNCIALYPYILI